MNFKKKKKNLREIVWNVQQNNNKKRKETNKTDRILSMPRASMGVTEIRLLLLKLWPCSTSWAIVELRCWKYDRAMSGILVSPFYCRWRVFFLKKIKEEEEKKLWRLFTGSKEKLEGEVENVDLEFFVIVSSKKEKKNLHMGGDSVFRRGKWGIQNVTERR